LNDLGNAYKDQGRLDDAVACYRRALKVAPLDAPVHSNLLFALLYHPRIDPDEVFREHQEFGVRHGRGPHARPARRSAGRRLRVGYVSPDLREHVVAFFLEPILASHDPVHFEITCYADVSTPDAVTRRLQGYVPNWRSLVGLTDAQAADLVRADQLDVLIDLAGHTGGNRLRMFALRPAPAQGTYLGYMGTTGLPAIDFRITDAFADPPGLTERYHTEALIRLPETSLCYQPGPTPDAADRPPAHTAGRVTFGSLNNSTKVSPDVAALWARVLRATPGSRLLLKTSGAAETDGRLREVFAAHRVEKDRVTFLGRTATRNDYLQLYQSIDVCLDPFPYNGITTTCDALWMGAPVVTLAGKTPVARMGVSLLTNVGLPELVAPTPDAYEACARRLATDLDLLAATRADLRGRMGRSPLMDPLRFVRRLEAAYRGIVENSSP
jgi:predicted O-linked N-acetylglucosamine transferase (SPINDLY family)